MREQKKVINIKIPQELWEQATKYSKKESLPLATKIRMLLLEFVEEKKKGAGNE